MSLGCQGATTLADATGWARPCGVDATSIYWIDQGRDFGNGSIPGGTLFASPIVGGPARLMGSFPSPARCVVGDKNIYVGSGFVFDMFVVPKAGGFGGSSSTAPAGSIAPIALVEGDIITNRAPSCSADNQNACFPNRYPGYAGLGYHNSRQGRDYLFSAGAVERATVDSTYIYWAGGSSIGWSPLHYGEPSGGLLTTLTPGPITSMAAFGETLWVAHATGPQESQLQGEILRVPLAAERPATPRTIAGGLGRYPTLFVDASGVYFSGGAGIERVDHDGSNRTTVVSLGYGLEKIGGFVADETNIYLGYGAALYRIAKPSAQPIADAGSPPPPPKTAPCTHTFVPLTITCTSSLTSVVTKYTPCCVDSAPDIDDPFASAMLGTMQGTQGCTTAMDSQIAGPYDTCDTTGGSSLICRFPTGRETPCAPLVLDRAPDGSEKYVAGCCGFLQTGDTIVRCGKTVTTNGQTTCALH